MEVFGLERYSLSMDPGMLFERLETTATDAKDLFEPFEERTVVGTLTRS